MCLKPYCRCQVWLDDYKQYYYNRIGKDIGDFGNVESRKQLRKNLQCKSFKWYLDTIFPELFIPGEAVAQVRYISNGYRPIYLILFLNHCCQHFLLPHHQYHDCHSRHYYWNWAWKIVLWLLLCSQGELRNSRENMCLDSAVRPDDMHKPVRIIFFAEISSF